MKVLSEIHHFLNHTWWVLLLANILSGLYWYRRGFKDGKEQS